MAVYVITLCPTGGLIIEVDNACHVQCFFKSSRVLCFYRSYLFVRFT
uniref:Uncharacterized protein n=1 Tax=Anguilla anguilla TaxID=7936 RepID=A0A0E9SYK2_ANGAN